MKGLKAKWTALLAAIGCFAVCLGVGVAQVAQPKQSETITASAAATVTRSMTKIAATAASSNTAIYFYAYSGDEAKSTTDWDNQYTFVEGTGDGVKYNGETLVGYDMKQPGNDIYFGLGGKTAVAGDILTLDGTFRNEKLDSNIVIDSGALTYNGSSWDRAYYTHELGEMVLSWPSEMSAHAKAGQLYTTPKSGATVPYPDGTWSTVFTYESGDGLKKNGEAFAMGEMKSVDSGLWFSFADVAVDDVVSISGTYSCATEEAKYVLEESKFVWNGTVWENYVPPVEYTTYTVSELTVHAHSVAGNENAKNTTLWLYGTGDNSDAWAYYTCESGTGVKLNGEALSCNVQDFGGGLYIKDFSVSAGDYITIGGTFVNEERATKYVINKDYHFQWDGSGWSVYTPPVVYEEYTLSNLQVANTSKAGGAYCANNILSLTMEGGGTVSDWPWFVYESGVGFQVNGESASLTGGIANAVQDTSGGLYFQFAGVNAGDYITIGGVFSNAELGFRYTIPESKFQWDGTEWENYLEPYEVGTLAIDSGTASGVYLKRADGNAFAATDGTWAEKLTFEAGSGTGAKLNDTTLTDIAIPGTIYVGVGAAKQGDVLTIGGTFYNENLKVKYVITESKFQWNGTEWVDYVEYTVHEIGALALHNNNGSATTLYLQRADGKELPVLDWDHVFTLESGDGWKVNGVSKALSEMKSTSAGLYLAFEAVPTNAVVSISGTYVYSNEPIKYVITESKFLWTGSAWEKYVEYTTHNVGNLTVNALSAPNGGAVANTSIYLLKEDGSTVDDWTYYTYVSGDGFKVNGESKSLTAIQNVGSGLYLAFSGVNKGDVISISGTYKCVDTALKYEIDEAHFTWTGAGWLKCYADGQLAAYDSISLSDLGCGLGGSVDATAEDVWDYTDISYTASAENTTGSVKFRFVFNSTNIASGATEIRLRAINEPYWQGIRFIIGENQIKSFYSSTSAAYALNSNTDYLIELGAIDLSDGANIWIYAKVDGIIVISDVVAKTATNPNEDGTPTFGTLNTNRINCYFGVGVYATLTDPDHVSITYTASRGDSKVDYADKNSDYKVLDVRAKTYDTLVGWVVNGALHFEGDTITVGEENITLTALEIDFRVQDGAAIRLAGTSDESGIRFTTLLKEEDLDALIGYDASVSYGTLIIPYDYLAYNQKPNLADFTPDTDILKIASTATSTSEKWEVNSDGYVVYRGAMQKLYTENYERLFAGRGYMEITLNGKTITVYTPFNEQDNIRSIRQISQAFRADVSDAAEGEIRYATISDTQKGIVDTYAAVDAIDLMDYASYAANNFLNIIAWNYPLLDESNEYNNTTNENIATQMKATGIRVVNLTGKNLLTFDSKENIEKTRQIIKFFWSQGLQTVAFAANNFANVNYDFTVLGTPDFSDCEGFIGFLHWDEPTEDDTIMSKLADLAIQFNDVYAGTDVIYMNNLLPSYYNGFNGNTATFKAYVAEYCEKVLSKVEGEKWLSVDSYPIKADYSLDESFLLDLGVIKSYAMDYGAHAHVALQSSGFESDDDSKKRIPNEAEMRMQAYAAMAFGMDSISWFTYSPSGSETETFYTFVDNDGNITDQDAYDAFTAVNTELNNIGAVYAAFDWKGVILGVGNDNTTYHIQDLWVDDADEDYNAFATVKGQIGDYELSASDTKHLSSVSTNKTDWNYLMGVMQDANGNEGYVLCNYNSHEEDRAQTITITFASNITEVVIYRGGVAETVKRGDTLEKASFSNKTLTVSLAMGEGVIILPSKLG